MRTLGTIFKTVISIMVLMYFGGSGALLDGVIAFAGVYGLITWYIFSYSDGGIFEGIGDGGFILALILNLCMPALVLVIPLFILEAILPGEIGGIIYGGCVIIACVGCVISDFVHVIRLFKPDFLGGDIDFLDD